MTVRNGFAQSYTPKSAPIQAYKAACKAVALTHESRRVIDGPIAVRLAFVMPRPQRLVWKTRPMPRVYAPTKPDVDNLAKGILDAMKELLWNDDNQIVWLSVEKFYAAGDEQPHTVLEVEEVG
jgi:Holliday junction resolvase RusA-like endonuclease